LSRAIIGLYGVLHYPVTRRQTEFGVRLALGARSASILRLVMRDVVGILTVDLVAALASVRLLEGLLFGLTPRDPLTIATAVVLLSAMAALAAYLPARRATRMDPLNALRSE
jgi:ABC-type antimicrobial peptide transport system permease subunit